MQYFLSQRKTGSVKKFDRITGTGLSSDRGYCRKPSEVTANIRLEVRFHEGIILLLYAQNTFFKSCDGSSLYAPLCAKEWRQAEDPEQGNPYPAGRIFEQQSGFFWKFLSFGHCSTPHTLFLAEVKGIARTGLASSEYAGEDYQMGRYRYETAYTKPGDALRKFYRSFDFASEMSNLDKIIKMMEKLSEVFSYQQGVTNFATTAEEAFCLGKGVCQDYSHILITLCYMAGIPARYVVGMLIGEGASHAWVEVFQNRHWFALDPTNMLLVNEDHIKISSGRDYNDCVINQGIMIGNAQQSQEVEVLVEEVGECDIGGNAGGRKA